MTNLTTQIKELRDTNERLLRAAARSTQETLAGLPAEADANTYDATGAAGSAAPGSRLVDRNL